MIKTISLKRQRCAYRVADPLIGGKRALFMPEELIIVKPARPPRRRGADVAIAGL